MTLLYYFIITLVLSKIVYSDFKEKAIYDIDLFAAAAVISVYKLFNSDLLTGLGGMCAAFITGYLIYAAALLIYKDEAFGFGDVLLLTVIGLFLGWPLFLHYFTVTMILTGFLFLLLILARPSLKQVAVPFAPILIIWLPAYFLAGTPTIFQIYAQFIQIANIFD